MTSGRRLMARLAARLLFLWVLAACPVLAGAVTLDDIRFTSLPGNEFELALDFSAAPPEPEAYTIDSPARIVVDFPGVRSTLADKKHQLSFENAKSAVVVSTAEKTRLVVSLNQMTGYSILLEGRRVILKVL